MKRIFLRFPNNVRKRDFIIIMLLICVLWFTRLEFMKGENSKFHPILKQSVKIFVNSDNIHDKENNVSNMKLSINFSSSQINETSTFMSTSLLVTEYLTTPLPPKTARQSLISQLLSMKNYQKFCGDDKSESKVVSVDEEMFNDDMHVDCSKSSFIFFAVLSHISSYYAREKVRQSWGSIRQLQNKKITIVFFIYSDKPITAKEKLSLKKENIDFFDTVLITTTRNIRNEFKMYLKAFQFTMLGCAKTDYFVVINDSVLVNIPTLLEALLTHRDISHPPSQTSSLFLCKVKKNVVAMRNKKSPWYVTNQEWSEKHYPPYCDIYQGFVMSYDILRDLLMCSYYAKRLWIADVFLTGILPQKIALTIEDFLEDFSTSPMKNHYIHGDMTHNVFLTNGNGYNHNTWRLIFNRSLREL